MSLIGTVPATTERVFTIEKPIHGLALTVNITGQWDVTTRADFLDRLDDIYNDLILTVAYKSKDGAKTTPYNAMSFLALAEFAQISEGIIQINTVGVGEYQLRTIIPLSEMGAIQFNNDETLDLTMITSGDVTNVEVRSIEAAEAAPDFLMFNKLNVLQGQTEKTFSVSEYDLIMIPLSALTASTTIDFSYTNGKTPTFNRGELESMGMVGNDICYNLDGKSFGGYGRYAIVDVSTVTEIEVNRASTSSFEIIAQYTALGDRSYLKKVEKSNNRLKSTTVAKYHAAVRKI